VGATDLCARAFLNAAKLVEDGTLSKLVDARYGGWSKPEAKAMLSGGASLEAISEATLAKAIDPKPRSGQQERLENLLQRHLY
jgi:xylose isomerase